MYLGFFMKILDWFKRKSGTRVWEERKFILNRPGIPKDNITSDEAFRFAQNMYFMQEPGFYLTFVPPENCSKCGSEILCKKSDYHVVEGNNIPFVYTYYCPQGCGYYSNPI